MLDVDGEQRHQAADTGRRLTIARGELDALLVQKEKEAACASLGEVMRKFPRASAVVKQGVEREQKRVRC